MNDHLKSEQSRPFIPKPPLNQTGLNKYRLPGCGLIVFFIALAWGIEIIDRIIPFIHLEALGIRPRSTAGLIGIFTMPWLHGDFFHLFSNTLTFVVLGYIVLATEKERFFSTSLKIIILSGLGTWLIGRGATHIGASALIYGYFGYLVTRAFLEQKLLWSILGVILCIFYGGMIFGVFPTKGAVSWEGHLAGFIAGIWLARNNHKRALTAQLTLAN